jgi:Asp-tRNA(Asn)/Glu-tRNA(Gln) amidotransferase A subunit family amidase
MTKSQAVQLAGTHLAAAAGGCAAAAIGVARLPTRTARSIRNGGIVMLTAIGLTSTPAAGAAVLSALPLMITAAVATVGARKAFDAMFGPDLDVVLTPSAMGEAPVGVDPIGARMMNAMWTLLHVPCLAVPVSSGPAGMPVGVQLVGPRFGEPRLTAIASVLAPILDPAAS